MIPIGRRRHRITLFAFLALGSAPAAPAAPATLDAQARAEGHSHDHHPALSDSAFAALQERGKVAMGVDQYTSAHTFEPLADGGRIELRRAEKTSAGVRDIRRHLRAIIASFSDGDFAVPGFVHAREVPGAMVMSERRAVISYVFSEVSGGGEVRITSRDAEAIRAIHAFLAFQRGEHRSRE